MVRVDTAAQMLDAVLAHSAADVLIMAAAVADFRPRTVAGDKIKKSELNADAPTLELERTADILAAVKVQRAATGFPRVAVGFAAESRDLLTYARDKMQRKGVDLLIANDISAHDAGFDVETNRVIILDAHGGQTALDLMSKARVSEAVVARVAGLLSAQKLR